MENTQHNQSEDLNVLEKIENVDASYVASFPYHQHITQAADKAMNADCDSSVRGPHAEEINDTDEFENCVTRPSADEEVNVKRADGTHVTGPGTDKEFNDINAYENLLAEPNADEEINDKNSYENCVIEGSADDKSVIYLGRC